MNGRRSHGVHAIMAAGAGHLPLGPLVRMAPVKSAFGACALVALLAGLWQVGELRGILAAASVAGTGDPGEYVESVDSGPLAPAAAARSDLNSARSPCWCPRTGSSPSHRTWPWPFLPPPCSGFSNSRSSAPGWHARRLRREATALAMEADTLAGLPDRATAPTRHRRGSRAMWTTLVWLGWAVAVFVVVLLLAKLAVVAAAALTAPLPAIALVWVIALAFGVMLRSARR